MYWGKERGRNFWIKRAIFIPIAIAAGVFIFGSVVMLLWNNLLPAIFGITTITFWQAIGLLVLSKILFGGFKGRWGGHRGGGWKHELHEKWHTMTPEEREKIKQEWRSRCRVWGKSNTEQNAGAE